MTLVADAEQLVAKAQARIGPEVTDEEAREVGLEVADLVVTNKAFVGVTLEEAVARLRRAMFPAAERVGRLVQIVSFIRAGEPFPAYPHTRIERGDIARVLGPKARIDEMGKHVGAVVRATTVSDVLTLALGLAVGYIIGYLSIEVGNIPISLGTPAGVMLAGIAISTMRSRSPLFGGPVSEGARSLLQDLGLDLFIAAVALNAAPSVAAAFAGGGVLEILGDRDHGGARAAVGRMGDRAQGPQTESRRAAGCAVRRALLHACAARRTGGIGQRRSRRRLSGALCRHRRAGADRGYLALFL